jgi:hypothetical protein
MRAGNFAAINGFQPGAHARGEGEREHRIYAAVAHPQRLLQRVTGRRQQLGQRASVVVS